MIPLLLPLLLPLCAESELLFVGVIWRHGDRAPGGLPYPLDAHNATAWPRGWNQLTNEGIKQMADLGTWLRNRYTVETEHINGVFNKDERALTSAQALTTALFPPEAEFVWKNGLTWQPVPIHSNGEDRDDPNTGMEITAANVDDLYDINREIIHGLKQPAWVTDDLVEQIKEFKRVHDGTLSALLYTMGIANDLLVPYAAAIIAELHREEGKEFVKIWYRNDTASATAEPVPLALPGCDAACPLGMFNNITAPLTINNVQFCWSNLTSYSVTYFFSAELDVLLISGEQVK
ncbi:pho-6 [Pristionchus pacificus]|uniref:Pho-6 n=1 Tax=Pristionchus pacificus TaxID=54126 RepID=A0A2A6C7M6_PRIPA|nr:pho-6 [Pristionchus pacificus]|eukprot:PDM74100.1 pho-6 [Pristionchus pacificus]